MPSDHASSVSSSDECTWSDAEDAEYEFTALHDSTIFTSLNDMLEHEKSKHAFDLTLLQSSLQLSLYDTIKVVNHVRRTQASASQVQAKIIEIRDDESLLRPVLEDDAVLFHLVVEEELSESSKSAEPSLSTKLNTLLAEYDILRQSMLKAIEDRPTNHDAAKPDNDSYYFDSYGYNDIHETMLKDTVRTDAYRDAVYDNKDIFKDKIVLDVGCGTGILALFCAKAGAKHVFAIDNSNIIDKARSNAYENGLDGCITFVKGKVEEIKLPVSEVDIVISEWMGYALLYESMLDSVLVARDRFLKKDGLMMPSQTTLVIAGISDKDYYDDRVNFWSDVYGFKMGAMKDGIFDDILLDSLDRGSLGTEPVVFENLDIHAISLRDLTFVKTFTLRLLPGQTSIVAFHIWFDTFFSPTRADSTTQRQPIEGSMKLFNGNAFSTGPHGRATHWKQAVLLIDGEIELSQNQEIQAAIEYRKGANNPRFLEILVQWHVTTIGANENLQSGSQTWHLA